MAFRYTPTPTPSVSPTISLTPSITPTNTPTGTVCPGLTPTATSTPEPTSTPTGTINPTPTMTSTPTGTISETPTMTPTPSSTPPSESCTVWEIYNDTFFEVLWSGIICGTETSTGGSIIVGQTITTGCIKDGTLGVTGSPTISVSAIC